MQTFVMLTRLAPEAVKSPTALEDLERKAVEAVKAKCPKVKWKDSYAVMIRVQPRQHLKDKCPPREIALASALFAAHRREGAAG